jgi:ABC-type nitrate/sulfonate/bicarbonate transport system ATPase subunit
VQLAAGEHEAAAGLRLLPWSSCLRNVALGLPGPRSRAQAQAREWLDRLGVGHLAGASASRISGGQAQRVAVARALARLPRLLLLDEALSAIDPDSVADVRACVLQHVHTTGAVAVWVTHEPYEQQTWASNHLRLAGRRA